MSKLDCMITVKGTGTKAKYGKPAKDTTRTVRDFLLDNDVYYRAVYSHLLTCSKCDPLECLQIYMERRKTKFDGQTSIGLRKLALKYDRLLRARGSQVPPDLLNEFIWRTTSASVLIDYQDRLSLMEKFQAMKLMVYADSIDKRGWSRVNHATYEFNHRAPVLGYILSIAKTKANPTTETEIEELIAVAEVHSS